MSKMRLNPAMGFTLDQSGFSFSVVKIRPDWAEAHNNLGLLYNALRRYDAAVESFRTALAIKPDLAWAHCNLGNALHAQRMFDAAIESYRRALAIDPGIAEAHLPMYKRLQERRQFDAAAAEMEKVYERVRA